MAEMGETNLHYKAQSNFWVSRIVGESAKEVRGGDHRASNLGQNSKADLRGKAGGEPHGKSKFGSNGKGEPCRHHPNLGPNGKGGGDPQGQKISNFGTPVNR